MLRVVISSDGKGEKIVVFFPTARIGLVLLSQESIPYLKLRFEFDLLLGAH